MPGLAFLNKKDFHTGTFKNIGKVWEAEQRALKSQDNYNQYKKKLEDEKYEYELKQLQVKAGLIKPSELEKMDWMYNSNVIEDSKCVTDEYLMGKAISHKREIKTLDRHNGMINPCDEFRLRHEDPLVKMKRYEFKNSKNVKSQKLQEILKIEKKIKKRY